MIAKAAFWLAVLAVLVLSLLPVEQVERLPFNFWDKAQHALAFGVLTLLGLWAWPLKEQRLWVFAGLSMLGVGIEVAQHFTGYRFGDWADFVADAAGVAVAALLILVPRGNRGR